MANEMDRVNSLPKKGNIRKCESNRTISLISHPSKISLYVLLNRMKSTIKRELDNAQVGFQEGRSTAEKICRLRILSEKYLENQKPLYHNFIDSKKAFDRVWQCQEFSTYWGKRSNRFSSKVGIRQDCVLSPYLLNLFLEFIITEALDSFD